ncbi:hypothetical protein Kpol_2002p24 [Vanderwaltozyma polyspora DSM 70294]|uniref:non-specific serine/threonine protein kinase n=1 Tax=Vanderwaltozyma polyspora (strain ATCC 22028 / DSM 70294 / BCRC 21397 / CBS 2163 / NBRC 10782 / NRRL Y-8283 / UCD 57-17) TaxID=436907 RepID=A7TFE0_VANPO|nr:uncharacterized protein Kpol_2002p24 [Vanderwaltozyma polyspora DSM 70294]EDO18954.1 hypothetical protein Kpol_2002p24 [Vanderwaltozyma polyspora DSM 70294]
MNNKIYNYTQPSSIYSIQECVGRGNFGDVYKAFDKTNGAIVAVKVVNLEHTEEDIDLLAQEIFFLAELRSPYITNYITTMIEDVSMWIVMEYCGGGACSDLIKTVYINGLPENKVGFITREVLKGLKYLHDQKKIHRDIKAANILLTDEGKVKLGDFGVSGQIRATMKRGTFVGTPYWMAPEVVNKESNGYNEKADIWSLGITVYELLKGLPPLSKCDPMKVMVSLPRRKPPKLHGQYSDVAKGFVAACLVKDPNLRPSAEMLLTNEFVTNTEINDLKSDIDFVKRRKVQNNYSKAPKFQLQEKLYNEANNEIPWDFNSVRSIKKIQKLPPTQPLQNSIELSPRSIKTDKSPSIPSLNMESPYRQNNCQTDSPITAQTTPSFRKYSENKQQIENQREANEFETPMDVDPICNTQGICDLKEFDYLKNVISYSFNRMHERAHDNETRMYVDNMMDNFTTTESKIPGFSEVFIEEISLRINSIKQYLSK